MLFEFLKNQFATSPILYIGYSNRDPNWRSVLNEMVAEFYPSTPPVSYRIAPNTDLVEKELLKAKNVETINGTLQDFHDIAAIELTPSDIESDRLARAKASVPSDLIDTFEQHPAAVLRLINTWTYVNQAPFHEPPNSDDFLRGDRPNWGLVASRRIFREGHRGRCL